MYIYEHFIGGGDISEQTERSPGLLCNAKVVKNDLENQFGKDLSKTEICNKIIQNNNL